MEWPRAQIVQKPRFGKRQKSIRWAIGIRTKIDGDPFSRLRAIKADIVKNLTDRLLSIETVAQRQGITPRYVSMLFESDATTFSEFVLIQRLNRAHRMLIDARFSDRTVSSVAFEAGFGDLSYFNRAFRRRYGATPSDVRANSRS
jgi:AraC-like DNA-binding protein